MPLQNPLSWIFFPLNTVIRCAVASAHFVSRFPDFVRPKIRCLGFSSRSTLSFAALSLLLISCLAPRTLSVRKSALGLLAFTRFSTAFQIFILKIFHFVNLVHMGHSLSLSPAQNPLYPVEILISSGIYTDFITVRNKERNVNHSTCF